TRRLRARPGGTPAKAERECGPGGQGNQVAAREHEEPLAAFILSEPRTLAHILNEKRPLIIERPSSVGRIVPNPASAAHSYPRSYLRTCRKEYQRSEIVSCSGDNTQTKITQAIVRCSAKERFHGQVGAEDNSLFSSYVAIDHDLKKKKPSGETKLKIRTLGELRSDADGRLIVIGGMGQSDFDPVGPETISEFANNDGWFDDMSDGPVQAELTIE